MSQLLIQTRISFYLYITKLNQNEIKLKQILYEKHCTNISLHGVTSWVVCHISPISEWVTRKITRYGVWSKNVNAIGTFSTFSWSSERDLNDGAVIMYDYTVEHSSIEYRTWWTIGYSEMNVFFPSEFLFIRCNETRMWWIGYRAKRS